MKTTGIHVLRDESITPCCRECSCDSSTCYQFDNCCPDIDTTTNKTSDFICADTMTKFKSIIGKPQNHNGFDYGIKRYLIVASCPRDFKDMFVISKCTGLNQTEYNDFLWVSHPGNAVIYQNHYCAQCHGVKHWVTWNIRTNCINNLVETNFQNVSSTLLSDDCEIINEVPELKVNDSRKYQCYVPGISSCPETGNTFSYIPQRYSLTSRKRVREMYTHLNPILYSNWGIQGYTYLSYFCSKI